MNNLAAVDTIKFAIATNSDNHLQEKHFGDSSKFIVYEYCDESIEFLTEITNAFQSDEDNDNHGSQSKGDKITQLLRNNLVDCIISKQFGKNIKIVNRNFIPAITNKKNVEDVVMDIEKNISIFSEALEHKTNDNKIIDLRN